MRTGWKGGHVVTVEAVTRKVAGEYVSSLHKCGLSAARIRDVCAAFSTYWIWLEKRGCVPETFNPWKGQAVARVTKAVALSSGDDQTDDDLRPFTTKELEALFRRSRISPFVTSCTSRHSPECGSRRLAA